VARKFRLKTVCLCASQFNLSISRLFLFKIYSPLVPFLCYGCLSIRSDFSIESSSDVWGTTNPYSANYSHAGSTGVEAALLAFGGSRLGIGTDMPGSVVRIPAHYSGIYSIKSSSQRFSKDGNNISVVGQEGIPAVYSPLMRTLYDLETFWRIIVGMTPWEYGQHFLLVIGGGSLKPFRAFLFLGELSISP